MKECLSILIRMVRSGVSLRCHPAGVGTLVALAAICAGPKASGVGVETNEIFRLQQQVKELIVDKSRLVDAGPIVEQLYQRTMELRGEEHPDTIVALHWVGYVAHQSGDYPKAIRNWERSLAIQEKFSDPSVEWLSRTLHMLSGVYADQHDLVRAEGLLKRSLALREEKLGPEHPETAQVVRTLGRFQKKRGNFGEAEALFLRALRIFEKNGKHSEAAVAETLFALGAFYSELGDWERTQNFAERALAIQERVLGPEHGQTLNSISLLAAALRERGQVAEAETLHRRHLKTREQAYGEESLTLMWPLLEVAQCALERGDYSEAELLLIRLRKMIETKLGPEHANLANVEEMFSRLEEKKGNWPQAYEHVKQALRLSEQHAGPLHHATMAYRLQCARLGAGLGRPGEALAAAPLIQEGEELRLKQVLSFTSERQRLVFHERLMNGHSLNLWASLGAVQPLARAILRTKSVVLDSLIEERQIGQASENPRFKQQIEELNRLRAQLAQAYFDDALPRRDNATTNRPSRRSDLAHDFEVLQSTLARDMAGLGGVRRALRVRIEEVQAAIPSDAALVEFIVYRPVASLSKQEKRYGALVLFRERDPVWVPLGVAAEIENTVKLLQHVLRRQDETESIPGLVRRLHGEIWEPVGAILPRNVHRVFVCPDSEVNFVSFAALVGPSGRFLGEELSISYVSSARDLLNEPAAREKIARLEIWANPDFEMSTKTSSDAQESLVPALASVSRGLRGFDFRSLPGTEKEGNALKARADRLGFKEAVLRLGRDASEAGLNRVQSPEVLHLATHGFVLSGRAGGENPMLHCGLALAGARRTVEAWAMGESIPSSNDGIVTAEEISCLSLRGTRLVVLSACDTGSGEARRGEGVLGLRRGFNQAGAQNLLLTLWPVDDDKTAGFIPEVYAAARRRGDFSEALATVQRSWLRKLRQEAGVAMACRIAGPFILSFQGSPPP